MNYSEKFILDKRISERVFYRLEWEKIQEGEKEEIVTTFSFGKVGRRRDFYLYP